MKIGRNLEGRCRLHPRYGGVRRRKSWDCAVCYELYRKNHPLKHGKTLRAPLGMDASLGL